MKVLVSLLVLLFVFRSYGGDASFSLESSTFKDGGPIPAKCAMKGVKGGENVSPALSWRNPPAGTKCFILICVDRHPVAQGWTHWTVLNVPAAKDGLKEGESVSGSGVSVLANSFKTSGWGGPMPPPGGGKHSYVFTLYALSAPAMLHIPAAPLPESYILSCVKDSILGEASITGTFER